MPLLTGLSAIISDRSFHKPFLMCKKPFTGEATKNLIGISTQTANK